jgi:hypothetical protein
LLKAQVDFSTFASFLQTFSRHLFLTVTSDTTAGINICRQTRKGAHSLAKPREELGDGLEDGRVAAGEPAGERAKPIGCTSVGRTSERPLPE